MSKEKSKESKKNLGQFYTTRYSYIFQDMKVPENIPEFVEPFVGQGDLLSLLSEQQRSITRMYDIDPKRDGVEVRDTLSHPPTYSNAFVLTNPPYLARNKNPKKDIYDKYGCNDLYKCFLSQLIQDPCLGGMLIIPLNFLCSIRKNDIHVRRRFFQVYSVLRINMFEEPVFDDTNYSVCSLQFTRKTAESYRTTIHLYPSHAEFSYVFSEENQYMVGGDLYALPTESNIQIYRETKYNQQKGYATNVLLKCIDDSETNLLGLSFVDDTERFIDDTERSTARSYATLRLNIPLSETEQKQLVDAFNAFLTEKRKTYHSLFLTNYRENQRKRISFEFAFQICNYLLNQLQKEDISPINN